MRLIGGELEHREILEHICFTDSGRSSLRLFIRSGNSKKKFIIPDFLCHVVEDVLKEENVDYIFYNILDDLSINISSIQSKNYDVLYLINYFGVVHDIRALNINNKIIIEDNVFFSNFKNTEQYEKWFSFNSFRKISSLADGSMVKTSLPVSECVKNSEARFVKLKEKAKINKYKYLNSGVGSERDYLRLFDEGEVMLDQQSEVYKMSDASLYRLLYIDKTNNQHVLKQRFDLMRQTFEKFDFGKNPDYYSFFPMRVKNRDALRSAMKKHGVFLPVHWSCATIKNRLYEEIISIPLFTIYEDNEFMYLVEKLKREVQW
ncbi:hypothetical protein MNBD_GAMMA11-1566 [hydrothermal vent metagenome]|uniref:Uncharacterized protein n=1 Tax=hydrothermal vent metagenome TaxID=652676 RepID=A0A3B0XJ61_9ZZZZ